MLGKRLTTPILMAAFCFAVPFFANAHSGPVHQREISECLFGSKYLQDEGAKDIIDYVSQGMDFGDVTRATELTKPGSSFLNAVRDKFPDFKASHREFGHWAFDGSIPKEVVADFELVYPGRGEEFKSLWSQFVRTRREAARLALGLSNDGARAAESITSLMGSCHDLGDWTTVQTEGLPSLKNVVRDIEYSYHRLLGNNNQFVAEFIEEIRNVPASLPPQERAEAIAHIWKSNKALHEATERVLRRYGFSGRFNPIDYKEVARFEKAVEKAATEILPGTRIVPPARMTKTATDLNRLMRKPVTKALRTPLTKDGAQKMAKEFGPDVEARPGVITKDGKLIVSIKDRAMKAGKVGALDGILVFAFDAGHALYRYESGDILYPELEREVGDAAIKGLAVGGCVAVTVFLASNPAGWVLFAVSTIAYIVTDAVLTAWHEYEDRQYLSVADLRAWGFDVESVLTPLSDSILTPQKGATILTPLDSGILTPLRR